MPELTKLLPWDQTDWDNMVDVSGCVGMDSRPYYYKVCPDDGCLLIISAVPSKKSKGKMHATDYLRIRPNSPSWRQLKTLL